MKKIVAMVLAAAMVLSMAACSSKETENQTNGAETTVAETVEETSANQDEVTVMSHAEYMAAEMDTQVTIEAYVQGKESWWSDKATVYAQDADGAYLLYDMSISEEDYKKLTVGQLIRVTGYKTQWEGQIEIMDAVCEILSGDTYVAEATDVTSILADTDALAAHMTELVAVNGLTVSAAPMYNWDNSGDRDNSDVYLTLALDGTDYSFTVRRYLTDNTTEVYKAAEALEVGQTVDVECFLYWYQGPQARITSITVK